VAGSFKHDNETWGSIKDFSRSTFLRVVSCNMKLRVKGKVVPVLKQAPHYEGVLGEWRYSSTHSLTPALDGGECQLHARPLYTQVKDHLVPTGEEAGWALEPFLTRW
jgi:hypothetical protein